MNRKERFDSSMKQQNSPAGDSSHMKGRRSCHLPSVGGRRKGADMTDDARRREELGKNGHDFDHVYCSEGTVGVRDEMGGRGISSFR